MKAIRLLLAILAVAAAGAAEPAAAWDAVFARDSGWTGADAAISLDLRDGRALWLFGDTWIGKVENGAHAKGSGIVRNTVAVHPQEPGAGAPNPEDVLFLAGPRTEGGRPTAWIRPDAGLDPEEDKTWYWPMSGVVVPDTDGRDRILLFLRRMARAGREGIWDFRKVGATLAVVEGPARPAEEWSPLQHDLPHDIAPGDAGLGRAETTWGVAAMLLPKKVLSPLDWVYVYGRRMRADGRGDLLLARVPAASAEDFGRWRFWGRAGWTESPAGATPIAEDVPAELSVEAVVMGGKWAFVMAHSEPPLGAGLMVRFSSRPEGPWSPPVEVHRAPGVAAGGERFAYAGKGHAHLSAPGRLLISWVVNSTDFAEMAGEAAIYRPRFVSVSLSQALARLPGS